MWVIIKEKFIRRGPLVAGGRNPGTYQYVIDRVVASLDKIESGETFFKCSVKK